MAIFIYLIVKAVLIITKGGKVLNENYYINLIYFKINHINTILKLSIISLFKQIFLFVVFQIFENKYYKLDFVTV
jgi:hypothetical protein